MPKPKRKKARVSPAAVMPPAVTPPPAPGAIVHAPPPLSPGQQVFKWILSGATEADILDAIAATWPRADARPLIVAAMGQIAESAQGDPQIIRGWCYEVTRDLYRRMIEIGDYAGALRAVKQLAELSKR